MHDSHGAQGQMSPAMMRKHYLLLGLNLIASTVIMYFVMFTMIWSVGELFNNLNTFYMALMMATPMGVLMLLMMGMMYRNRRWNAALYATFALMFALSFYGMREQALVGDRQFLRSMIPHHSGAVLMCRHASIEDPEIRALCDGIVASQTEEIALMKRMLARQAQDD
jgi:uncharacterized protein (DUF305 family)